MLLMTECKTKKERAKTESNARCSFVVWGSTGEVASLMTAEDSLEAV